MTARYELFNHPRLSFEAQPDGSTVARFAMNGWGADIVCRYWPVNKPGQDPWIYDLEPIEGAGGPQQSVWGNPDEGRCSSHAPETFDISLTTNLKDLASGPRPRGVVCWRGPLGTAGIAGEIGAPANKGGVYCRELRGPGPAASGRRAVPVTL